MFRWLLLLAALGLALRGLVLFRRLRKEARTGGAARGACLDAVAPLLSDPRGRVEPSGFPRLAGSYAGHAFDIQAVPDSLTFRKLPALWLMVTLTEPQPLRGETRLMRRPSGMEPFSHFADLPAETPPPPGFPPEVVLRATAPGDMPPAEFLAGLAPLFADPRLKEVVLAPKGLRLVRLAEEAARGGYLLFREADLGRAPIPAAMARPMFQSLITLAEDLADATGDRHLG